MSEGADIKEIIFSAPQIQPITASYEGQQEVSVDLGGTRSIDGAVDGNGRPIKRDEVKVAKVELPNIQGDKETYELFLDAQRKGAQGVLLLALINGDVYKMEEAYIVADSTKNLKTGVTGLTFNAAGYPKSKKIS